MQVKRLKWFMKHVILTPMPKMLQARLELFH